jgi:hypothetical protein
MEPCDEMWFAFPSSNRSIVVRGRPELRASLRSGGGAFHHPPVVRFGKRSVAVLVHQKKIGPQRGATPWMAGATSAAGCAGQGIALDFVPNHGRIRP